MYGASDTEEAAMRTARAIRDPRVRHFYDPDKLAGNAVAASLGGEGETACDVYLFYEQNAVWQHRPPVPVAWAHQLMDCSWADPSRIRCGDDLVSELRQATGRLTTNSS